jgi:dTDP-3-amino-3,4,6-trideoxy-alpha-D-glucose transaminase
MGTTSQRLRSKPTVPFLDLGAVHDGLKAQLLAEFADLIDSNAFTNGPQVREFEEAFAGYCGTASCVGVASGLDALRLGLLAAGIAAEDEVIVPANTFVATLEAVTQAGGRPVLVDASEDDWNLDVRAAERAVGSRTRFLMPVHLYGQLADMNQLKRLGLPIVEDACQAHGATRDGLRAGASGLAAAFSFYPGKNLGAFGDAGALVTSDEQLAERVGMLREHGQAQKYRHEVEGWTARLDTIQALVLLRKLPLLDEWNARRREAAAYYLEHLAGVGDLSLPPVAAQSRPVWHLFVVRSARRDELAAFLEERGIATGLHYPQPAHLSAAYEWLGYREGDFPVAEAMAREVLSLPIFPGIGELQLDAVAGAVRDFFSGGH